MCGGHCFMILENMPHPCDKFRDGEETRNSRKRLPPYNAVFVRRRRCHESNQTTDRRGRHLQTVRGVQLDGFKNPIRQNN
jgi:hypothetical protein